MVLIKAVKQGDSLYLLIPADLASTGNVETGTEFGLSVSMDSNKLKLVYDKIKPVDI